MAHFAKVNKDNIVLTVHVVDNKHLLNEDGVEKEALGIAYLNEVHGALPNGETWIQTSFNGTFRKRYAGIGDTDTLVGAYTYDTVKDTFIRPKPFASWTLSADSDWEPPTAKPDDGKKYCWNEDTLAWDDPVEEEE
jgi:hypothetical protein